jgi:molecular chaperone GrpE
LNRSDRKDKGNGDGIEIPVTGVEESVNLNAEEEPAQKQSVTIPREDYEALVEEAERSREQYLLAVADFENFRKRVEKEKEEIVCFANERLIHELLPILDNLQRALSMGLDQAGTESILEGVRMVSNQLHSILGACGLEPVEAVGGPFDPQHHEAVGVLPSDEPVDGTVISELQKGYRLKGKILRPSMVHVAGQPSGTRDNEGEN